MLISLLCRQTPMRSTTDLGTGVMPQVHPVDIEFAVIERMDQLVRNRLLQVLLGRVLVLT